MAKFPAPEALPDAKPSQDHSRRYQDDQLLRLHGFQIHARPRGCEPLWMRDGELLLQSEALLRCRKENR